ncbi:MAG: hypothetical protein WC619_04380 [Patescibacteria group bacterium]
MFEYINSIITLSNLVGLSAFVALFLVFLNYKNDKFNRYNQVLISLKHQLSISGSWASADNEGYVGHPDDTRKLEFTNPSRIIFDIENSSLKDVMVQLGVIDFSDKFHEALANYNQGIRTLNSLESFRRDLCSSNIEISRIVQLKIQLEFSQVHHDYNRFIGSFNLSNPDEKSALYLANNIYNYNENIHYKVIGSRNSKGLKTFYHIIQEEIEKQEKKIKNEKITFSIIFFFLCLLSLLALFSFLAFSFTNFEQIFILFLLSFLIVVLSQLFT